MKKFIFILLVIFLVLTGCKRKKMFTVYFDSQEGTTVASANVEKNHVIGLEIPKREGYTFEGWYMTSCFDGSQFTSSTPVTDDITLYAKWSINQYTIIFDTNDGSTIGQIIQDYDSPVSRPDDPVKEGHTFGGWYRDENHTQAYAFTTMPSEDITLYARWTVNQYAISFEVDGGSTIEPIIQDYDTPVSRPDDPVKEGHTFSGWYSDQNHTQAYAFTTMPSEDITLYARWTVNQYEISFEEDGGSTIEPIVQDYDTPVSKPDDPVKEGHTFAGWYRDQNHTLAYAFTTMPSENITLYARWTVNQYEIIYGIMADDYDRNLDIPLNAGEAVNQVYLGFWHSAVVTTEGRLFTWGNNWGGELGDGTRTDKSLPNDITVYFNLHPGETIVQISMGCYFSVALTSENRLFTWGANDHGQLGYGTKGYQSLPVDITGNIDLNVGETIVQMSSGFGHTSALTSEGRLFLWGRNYEGQLGDGSTADKLLPTDMTAKMPLNDGETIIKISLGGYHSSALTSKGRLFTWGYNEYGQLGDGSTIDKSLPADITGSFDLNAGDKITQISLGISHSSALTSGGRLFTWGSNDYGQLGDGTTASKLFPTEITGNFDLIAGDTLTQVYLSRLYSSAQTSEGRIFTWGCNNFGQLGDGTTVNKSLPNDITDNFRLNAEEMIMQISFGSQHSSALSSDGHLFMWGRNQFGELGDGTETSRLMPVKTRFCYSEIIISEIRDFNNDILLYVPTRDGYTFSGWYSDVYLENVFDLTTMPAQNVRLFGKFIPNE